MAKLLAATFQIALVHNIVSKYIINLSQKTIGVLTRPFYSKGGQWQHRRRFQKRLEMFSTLGTYVLCWVFLSCDAGSVRSTIMVLAYWLSTCGFEFFLA